MTTIIDGSAGITFPAGSNPQAAPSKVLQVVSATYATQVSTTSSSLSDTGLTATITPLFSTSKILILVTQAYVDTSASGGVSTINRAGTDVITFANAVSQSGSGTGAGQQSLMYLDSPATTSSTIYKTRFARLSGAGTIYAQYNDGTVGQGYSIITLMEIAA